MQILPILSINIHLDEQPTYSDQFLTRIKFVHGESVLTHH